MLRSFFVCNIMTSLPLVLLLCRYVTGLRIGEAENNAINSVMRMAQTVPNLQNWTSNLNQTENQIKNFFSPKYPNLLQECAQAINSTVDYYSGLLEPAAIHTLMTVAKDTAPPLALLQESVASGTMHSLLSKWAVDAERALNEPKESGIMENLKTALFTEDIRTRLLLENMENNGFYFELRIQVIAHKYGKGFKVLFANTNNAKHGIQTVCFGMHFCQGTKLIQLYANWKPSRQWKNGMLSVGGGVYVTEFPASPCTGMFRMRIGFFTQIGKPNAAWDQGGGLKGFNSLFSQLPVGFAFRVSLLWIFDFGTGKFITEPNEPQILWNLVYGIVPNAGRPKKMLVLSTGGDLKAMWTGEAPKIGFGIDAHYLYGDPTEPEPSDAIERQHRLSPDC